MITIQIDDATFSAAIANAILASLNPQAHTTPTPTPQKEAVKNPQVITHPTKNYNYIDGIKRAKELFADVSYTAPKADELNLYYAWVETLGYGPVTAAEFIQKVKRNEKAVKLTTLLRSANSSVGIGLKLSEYAANHDWLKRVKAGQKTTAVYGVPKP